MAFDEPLAFRDTEQLALGRAVAVHRLVTVTGAPGIGKSALVHAFARPRRGTGVATVVRLEGARTLLEAVHDIARALALSIPAAADGAFIAERIGRVLATRKRAPLVLDDVDRCRVAIAKLVARWRDEAPLATFVVTARGKLGLPGEHRLELGPLDVPAARERDPDAIARASAVQLLVRSAGAVRPGFRVDATNARTVARIVRRLEGVPLAIELCAARLRALSVDDVAALLSERLDLLHEEGRSLRSAFALSWDDLAPDEARLLAACSVFRGGFTLEAASAVMVARDAKDRVRVARSLERLVDASLVRADEQRYFLLATLREFAAEKLGAAVETEERHARYYASLRLGPISLDALALERKNLEVAFDRSLRSGLAGGAAALVSYAPVALARGPLAPFVERVTRALDRLRLSREEHAELLYWRGLGHIFRGRRDDGAVDLAQAHREARAIGLHRIEALAASKHALILGLKGAVAEALALGEEARVAATASRDDRTRGIVGKDRANVLAEAGRNDDAVVELGRALKFLRAAGDLREEAFVLMMLGARLADDGLLVEARRDLGASVEILRKLGDRRTEAWALAVMALAIAEEGKLGDARAHLEHALSLIRDVDDAQTEGMILGFLGNVALEQRVLVDAERAYRDAITLLARARDRAAEGAVTATAAVVDHALGRIPAARDGMARARKLLASDGRPARREAAAILATILGDEGSPALDDTPHEEVRFARRIAMLYADGAPPSRPPVAELVVAHDGSWVRTSSGDVAKLGAGRPIARVMRQLALERLRHPGRAVPTHALVRAGWPDERVLPAAAKNRLHVTIARLRRVVLDGALVHADDGYMLDPDLPARLADETESAQT